MQCVAVAAAVCAGWGRRKPLRPRFKYLQQRKKTTAFNTGSSALLATKGIMVMDTYILLWQGGRASCMQSLNKPMLAKFLVGAKILSFLHQNKLRLLKK